MNIPATVPPSAASPWPRSTYRIQFHKGFTFDDAAAIVPYLAELGISHLYASPYLKAVPGSTHGYDVIDHSVLNPEIGDERSFGRLNAELARCGMSQILDTVPNHMGVATNVNRWWNDLLEHGVQSRYADFFDIDWEGHPGSPQMHGKVLLPILGESYGHALQKRLLKIERIDGKLFVTYFDRRFPIDPATTPEGDPLSLDIPKLDALLNRQHYRLCHWRVASEEMNYRRFFDVDSLAGLRMENPDVFEAVHRYTFELIDRGILTGIRIDHPDGLWDPKVYFERLQQKKPALHVTIEKILTGDERMPGDWNVAGTSGYDALSAINDLLINHEQAVAFTAVYTNFTSDNTAYEEIVYRNKKRIIEMSFRSELRSLTRRLYLLAQTDSGSRDFTFRQLRDGLREVIACFGVYRTYIAEQGVDPNDQSLIDAAVEKAISRNSGITSPDQDGFNLSKDLFDFIRDTLLLKSMLPPDLQAERLKVAGRFQQLTSPVTAKGIEDTTFYEYNRLASLNEVGGNPGSFGRSVDDIHAYFADRQQNFPGGLTPLSTHDTKRSEDVRARLSVLSDMPEQWRACLSEWAHLNRERAAKVHPNDQYFLYQTLLGAWPMQPMDADHRSQFVARILAYLQKALREGKARSSWLSPDEEYEASVKRLAEDLIDPQISPEFQKSFIAFQRRISELGMLNSLSQTLVRMTAPGIPDTYQGTELWDLSLVDPDNRRPVDYSRRARLLSEIKSGDVDPMKLLSEKEDGRIKLWLTWKALGFRNRFADLYARGRYTPIRAQGPLAKHIFAFARVHEQKAAITAVTRLHHRLPLSDEDAGPRDKSSSEWAQTKLLLPPAFANSQLNNVLSNDRFAPADSVVSATQLFAKLPIALLENV